MKRTVRGRTGVFSGFTLQWCCLKGLSATWVARLFLASPLMYCHWLRALVSIIAHFLGTKMLILCYIRRGQAASSSSSELYVKSDSFCESLCHRRHVQIPLTCLLLPFISPRSFCAAHPSFFFCCPSMRNLVCRVNRGPENNKHKKKGKFPPRRPFPSIASPPFSVPTTCCPLFVA